MLHDPNESSKTNFVEALGRLFVGRVENLSYDGVREKKYFPRRQKIFSAFAKNPVFSVFFAI
jgi:hypothetical protein